MLRKMVALVALSVILLAVACASGDDPQPTQVAIPYFQATAEYSEAKLTKAGAVSNVIEHIRKGIPIQYEEKEPIIDFPDCKEGMPDDECFSLMIEATKKHMEEDGPWRAFLWGEDRECEAWNYDWDPSQAHIYVEHDIWNAEYHSGEELTEATRRLAEGLGSNTEEVVNHGGVWTVMVFTRVEGCKWEVMDDSGSIYNVRHSSHWIP